MKRTSDLIISGETAKPTENSKTAVKTVDAAWEAYQRAVRETSPRVVNGVAETQPRPMSLASIQRVQTAIRRMDVSGISAGDYRRDILLSLMDAGSPQQFFHVLYDSAVEANKDSQGRLIAIDSSLRSTGSVWKDAGQKVVSIADQATGPVRALVGQMRANSDENVSRQAGNWITLAAEPPAGPKGKGNVVSISDGKKAPAATMPGVMVPRRRLAATGTDGPRHLLGGPSMRPGMSPMRTDVEGLDMPAGVGAHGQVQSAAASSHKAAAESLNAMQQKALDRLAAMLQNPKTRTATLNALANANEAVQAQAAEADMAAMLAKMGMKMPTKAPRFRASVEEALRKLEAQGGGRSDLGMRTEDGFDQFAGQLKAKGQTGAHPAIVQDIQELDERTARQAVQNIQTAYASSRPAYAGQVVQPTEVYIRVPSSVKGSQSKSLKAIQTMADDANRQGAKVYLAIGDGKAVRYGTGESKDMPIVHATLTARVKAAGARVTAMIAGKWGETRGPAFDLENLVALKRNIGDLDKQVREARKNLEAKPGDKGSAKELQTQQGKLAQAQQELTAEQRRMRWSAPAAIEAVERGIAPLSKEELDLLKATWADAKTFNEALETYLTQGSDLFKNAQAAQDAGLKKEVAEALVGAVGKVKFYEQGPVGVIEAFRAASYLRQIHYNYDPSKVLDAFSQEELIDQAFEQLSLMLSGLENDPVIGGKDFNAAKARLSSAFDDFLTRLTQDNKPDWLIKEFRVYKTLSMAEAFDDKGVTRATAVKAAVLRAIKGTDMLGTVLVVPDQKDPAAQDKLQGEITSGRRIHPGRSCGFEEVEDLDHRKNHDDDGGRL